MSVPAPDTSAPVVQDIDAPLPEKKEQVTPWDVADVVDYEKLVRDFGCSKINEELIARVERVTGKKAHTFLRRGIFFSHRDLEKVLDLYEKGEQFYIYTGRGPSSDSMHMGHLVPFLFTKWLQETFDVPLVIQMTDDEKFYFKDLTIEQLEKMTQDNVKDIIAMGFDMNKTFIFNNFDYVGTMYKTIARIEKATTANQVRGCFGFKGEDNVGKWMFPAIQAAPSFSVCFPHLFPNPKKNVYCLIPQAIDQDPYFRLTRDIAPRLGFLKPALIHSRFFPGLSGSAGKMSSSVGAAVFLTDTEKQIKTKINAAFSGGGKTKEEQLLMGGLNEVDVPIQWLSFFLDDDDEFARIQHEYAAGRMMSGDVKKVLIEIVSKIVKGHQEARKNVTGDVVKTFMSVRPLKYEGNKKAKATVAADASSSSAAAAASPTTKKSVATPAPAATDSSSSMSKVAFIVGRVVEVAKHPESAKLYVEKIDIGEPTGPRTILSGLQEHVKEEDFINKLVLVVANLEPRKIGGIPSAGMVLCASSEGKGKIELLNVPEGTPIGERVVFAGHEQPAEPVLKKKLAKHWEEVAPTLTTDANGIATWNGMAFTTSVGPITSSITNGIVS